MKNRFTLRCAFSAFLLVMLTGCATVHTASNFDGTKTNGVRTPRATISVENYGYYLFGVVPLIAGNPLYPNENICMMFSDTVTLQNNQRMLSDTAHMFNARALANEKTTVLWTGSFSFWVIWRKVIHTSAVAVQ